MVYQSRRKMSFDEMKDKVAVERVESMFENAKLKAQKAKASAEVNLSPSKLSEEEMECIVSYLHHAAGKNGFALPGVSLDMIRRWVEFNGVTTVGTMLYMFYQIRMDETNYKFHKVHINDFVNAFEFPTITKSNVKEYATGIFKYLLSDDQKHLSQLKGKRLQSFLADVSKIVDARSVLLNKYIVDCYVPEDRMVDLGYSALPNGILNIN